jgi:hypothetical protein
MGLKFSLGAIFAALVLVTASLCHFKEGRYVETLLLWMLVSFPGLFLWIIHQQYRSILQGRKDEINSIMARGKTFSAYLKAFESTGSERSLKKTMDRLFYRKFGRSKYHFSLGMNTFLGALFVLVILTWAKAPMGLPADLATRVQALPLATVAGLSGAFIWGLYDVLRRYEAVDLSPGALHSIWLRMLVASVVAPMVSAAFAGPLKPTVAFAVGLFPTTELFDFVKGQARKGLNMSMSAVALSNWPAFKRI